MFACLLHRRVNAVDVGGSSRFGELLFLTLFSCFSLSEELNTLFFFSISLCCSVLLLLDVVNHYKIQLLSHFSACFCTRFPFNWCAVSSCPFSFLSFFHAVVLALWLFLLASLEVIILLCYPRIPAEGERGVACVWDYRLEWLSSPAGLLSLSVSIPPCFSLALLGILQMWSS